MAMFLGQFATCLAGTVVNGLENVPIQSSCLGRIKRKLEHGKGVSESLHSQSNGTVSHVGVARFWDGIKVTINDLVEIARQNHGNLHEFFKIKNDRGVGQSFRVGQRSHELGETDTCQVADGRFVGSGVFNNFRAKVGAADGSQVLLIGLGVGMILVEHVGRSRFDLRVQNGKPQLLCLNGLAGLAFLFVPFVEFDKFVSVHVGQSRCLVGTKEGPGAVALDAFHEQIGNPQGVEQVSGSIGFVSVVFAEIQKGKNVGMPRFQVAGNASLAFAASLIDVPSRVVKDSQHGNDPVGGSVGASNVGLTGTNVVNGDSNASGVLGDDGTSLERFVDSFNGVCLHGQEEAGGHLW
mmetsp:Transcript_12764/g.23829  ORF Transcript_12764/g.23829 Transcript_12764/m.23829 type:complete len:351 (-) Transcript_12764:99-1151(-)